MEPITHGLSGAVMACILPRTSRPRWFPLWAALTAMVPDVDVLFVHNPVDYIEFHRGITHSLAGGWVLALGCALILVMLTSCRFKPQKLGDSPSPEPWSLIGAWCMAYLIILHHIFLDCMNSYGTQVLLPFSDYRVRWNALFIVDPLLLVPLLVGLIRKHAHRAVMFGLLVWTLVYPLGALTARLVLQDCLSSDLHVADTTATSADVIDPEAGLSLVPDAFTPFHWKLVLGRGDDWQVAGYTVGKGLPATWTDYGKPSRSLWLELGERDRTFSIYERFAAFPAVDDVQVLENGEKQYTFSDLRFGSTIPFVDAIQTRRDDGSLSFRIQARIQPDGELTAVRLVTVTGAGGDSGWQAPSPGQSRF